MRLAVTDACIFIDLFDLGLVEAFFELSFEIHTTHHVFFELDAAQQASLKNARVNVYNLQAQDYLDILKLEIPKSLSIADKSVIHIAEKLGAMVLSSDKVVRNSAKNRKIDYHGMLWIFDQLVAQGIISKEVALNKLIELQRVNAMFTGNPELTKEIQKRKDDWKR